uniref:WW domain-containing oxidoreductase n=1 Tax=Macrostomum lignano TaxID=282301 RepID=A0A1I8FCB3_9PLAT
AKVIMLVRSLERGKLARDRIWEKHPARRFALAFCRGFSEPHIDILVNNAGIFGAPFEADERGAWSPRWLSIIWAILWLTCMLLSKGQLSQGAKVILVTGAVYKRGNFEVSEWNSWTEESYKKMKAYSNSNWRSVCLPCGCAAALRRLSSATAMVYAVCTPVWFAHDIGRHVVRGCIAPCRPCLRCCMRCMMLSPRQGCKRHFAPGRRHGNGQRQEWKIYFNKMLAGEPWHKPVLNSDPGDALLDFSFELGEAGAR